MNEKSTTESYRKRKICVFGPIFQEKESNEWKTRRENNHKQKKHLKTAGILCCHAVKIKIHNA